MDVFVFILLLKRVEHQANRPGRGISTLSLPPPLCIITMKNRLIYACSDKPRWRRIVRDHDRRPTTPEHYVLCSTYEIMVRQWTYIHRRKGLSCLRYETSSGLDQITRRHVQVSGGRLAQVVFRNILRKVIDSEGKSDDSSRLCNCAIIWLKRRNHAYVRWSALRRGHRNWGTCWDSRDSAFRLAIAFVGLTVVVYGQSGGIFAPSQTV